jgi:outer membrane protein OmpA-like peptidoglycan-associated protein
MVSLSPAAKHKFSILNVSATAMCFAWITVSSAAAQSSEPVTTPDVNQTQAQASAPQTQTQASPANTNAQPVSQAEAQAYTGDQAASKPLTTESNEGFWGHLNPFARKKWVNRQLAPTKDRLNELDQLSAQNANGIKDVDSRSQVGIQHAQSTADQAGQQAAQANGTATQADQLAKQAGSQTQQLNSTVASLDNYHPVSETEIRFRSGQTVLNAKAKDALDGIASQVTGNRGYLIEVQGYSKVKGQAGIESSQRLADSVVRYFVEQHQVPVYRIHVLGMGNAEPQDSNGGTTSGSLVHVTLVQNSLAALNSPGSTGSSPIGGTQATPRSVGSSQSAQ